MTDPKEKLTYHWPSEQVKNEKGEVIGESSMETIRQWCLKCVEESKKAEAYRELAIEYNYDAAKFIGLARSKENISKTIDDEVFRILNEPKQKD